MRGKRQRRGEGGERIRLMGGGVEYLCMEMQQFHVHKNTHGM